jgi:hypothetical protein
LVGLEVTAVHNHILRASPATLYMHIGGMGDPAKLGKAIHGALVPVHIPLNASYNIEITGYSGAPPEAFKPACLKYSYASSNTK